MSSDGEEGKRRGGARWMAQSVACTIRRSDAATPILWIAPIRAARCATRAVDRRPAGGSQRTRVGSGIRILKETSEWSAVLATLLDV